MTDFSPGQLRQMEQEAIERLKEMKQRAKKTAEQQGWTGSLPTQAEQPQPQTHQALPPPVQPPPAKETVQGQGGSPLAGLMQRLGGERGVLLALLALLMGEGADPSLLLALFWLAMAEDDGSHPTA